MASKKAVYDDDRHCEVEEAAVGDGDVSSRVYDVFTLSHRVSAVSSLLLLFRTAKRFILVNFATSQFLLY